jgi:hypothetical protein
MQKVEGSSPFSRFVRKSRSGELFLWRASSTIVTTLPSMTASIDQSTLLTLSSKTATQTREVLLVLRHQDVRA